MTHDTMLHIDQTLDEPRREALIRKISALSGGEPRFHSAKPHLIFVPFNMDVGTEAMVRAVRAEGLSVHVVDF